MAVVVGPYVVRRRLKEAFEQRYIVGPDIRKRSHSNTKEYTYFLKCENPEHTYLKYREDENIIYHAQMSGFCDLWIIAMEKIDVVDPPSPADLISGDILYQCGQISMCGPVPGEAPWPG